MERRRLQQEKQRQGCTGDTEATSNAVAEQQPGLADKDRGGLSPDKEQEGEAVVSGHGLVQLAAQQPALALPAGCETAVLGLCIVQCRVPDSPALRLHCLVQLAAAAVSLSAMHDARQQCSLSAVNCAAGSSSSQGQCPMQDARQQRSFIHGTMQLWHHPPALRPLAHCQTAASSAGACRVSKRSHACTPKPFCCSINSSSCSHLAGNVTFGALEVTCLQDDHHLPAGTSPYASISATLGWETFHMVHTLWLGLMELPVKAPDKDWDMQVSSRTARLGKLCRAPASR